MKILSRIVALFALVLAFSCQQEDADQYRTYDVSVLLVYPTDAVEGSAEGLTVKMTNGGNTFETTTDANGLATFKLSAGIYELSASDSRSEGGIAYNYTGSKTGITVNETWDATSMVELQLEESQASQIVIKEIFVGGTPKDDGSGSFSFDKYVILYNNSDTEANLGNLCLGMISPNNAQATNNYYGLDGNLIYASEGWVPAAQGYWYFQNSVTLAPGEEMVIALNNAVDNTLTYSNSINLANSNYYVTYDMEVYDNTSYYVSPSDLIPSSHYLKGVKYGAGNAWALSVTSPGFFIFDPQGTTPAAFAADASTTHSSGAKMVKNEWVVDAMEVFLMDSDKNQKRFTAVHDAGYVYHQSKLGYSVHRNVDKEATEALASNAGKLVYGYSLGTTDVGGSTDPSGIDAKASAAAGARIIYKDSNNSSDDFHLRSKASLRAN